MDKKIVKVSVLTGKPYFCGGFDTESADGRLCVVIRAIQNILEDFSKQDKIVIGLTGLALGIDQEFAQICLSKGLVYQVYLAYDGMDKNWKNLPDTTAKRYQDLLDRSENTIVMAEGAFSPKKILQQKIKIVRESDVIIRVDSKLPNKNQTIRSLLKTKTVIDI